MSDQPASRVPECVDAWRMVAARREFEGRIPLAAMTRLRDSLFDPEGEVRYTIAFGTDVLKVPFAELRIEAELPLECQSSLRRFLLPVQLVQRLGLIRDEADEAALPPDYEALPVEADGMLSPASLVEDELILALPVVPVAPDAEAVERDFAPTVEETAQANPFAALAGWKKE
ncbi:MAG: YceD family protein [Thermomonas sp.]|uniref:YceD family protein n=1 Tax=Thermomonas sp. TaxID=1971895 RepID=UPI0039E66226